jgi:hypothetical protein
LWIIRSRTAHTGGKSRRGGSTLLREGQACRLRSVPRLTRVTIVPVFNWTDERGGQDRTSAADGSYPRQQRSHRRASDSLVACLVEPWT